MKFYFSGAAGNGEIAMLHKAGVERILVDPDDYWGVLYYLERQRGEIWWPNIALDSGAYRAYKNGEELDLHEFAAALLRMDANNFDFVVAPDVIGDPTATIVNARELWMNGIDCVPVWHWGSPLEHLNYYLTVSELVGIGALVEPMREKNERVLRQLVDLCFAYPQRFHLFGLAWPKAIEKVAPYAYSADSSVWLRGARYAYAIFKHRGHGHLTQAPAKLIPEYKGLDREERCIQNAKNIEEFLKEVKNGS